MKTGNKIVDKISEMEFQGNIIPTKWMKNITFANKKPHVVAVVILSEIVYWYRMSLVRNENGKIIKAKKKFKADKLQRSYQSFVDQFGFTKRQVKDAIQFLVDYGILVREFRHIKTETGLTIPNVMFVEPVIDMIQKITYEEVDLFTLKESEEMVSSPDQTIEGLLEEEEKKITYTEDSYEEESDLDKKEAVAQVNLITTSIEEESCRETNQYEKSFAFFEQNGFGLAKDYLAKQITYWCNDLSEEVVIEAMKIALHYGSTRWRYVVTILTNWRELGVETIDCVHRLRKEKPQMQAKKRVTSSRHRYQEPIPHWLEARKMSRDSKVRIENNLDVETEQLKKNLQQRLKKYEKRLA